MLKCKCNNIIPQGRVDLGYSECVDCSTVEAVGCVDICYHKTGNTIQVMDKASAAKINKLAQRSGYGIMRGLRGGTASKSKTKTSGSVPVFRIPTEDDYARTLRDLEYNIDRGAAWCKSWIDGLYRSHTLSGTHVRYLNTIIDTLIPPTVYKQTNINNEVDEQIAYAFKNWRQ